MNTSIARTESQVYCRFVKTDKINGILTLKTDL